MPMIASPTRSRTGQGFREGPPVAQTLQSCSVATPRDLARRLDTEEEAVIDTLLRLVDTGQVEWLRPVSKAPDEAVSEQDYFRWKRPCDRAYLWQVDPARRPRFR